MKKVCQKCGDQGFPELLNYCMKCNVVAEHTYCLDVLPKNLDEKVVWNCQFCLIGAANGHDTTGGSSCIPQITSDEAIKAVRIQKWKTSDAYLKAQEKAEDGKLFPSLQSGQAQKRLCLNLTDSIELEFDCSDLQKEDKKANACCQSCEEHQGSTGQNRMSVENRGGPNEKVFPVEKESSQNRTNDLPNTLDLDLNVNVRPILDENMTRMLGQSCVQDQNLSAKDASQNGTIDLPKDLDLDLNVNAQPILDENRTRMFGQSCVQDQNLSEQNRSILEDRCGTNEVACPVAEEASQNGTIDLPKDLDHDLNVNARPILVENNKIAGDQSRGLQDLSEQNRLIVEYMGGSNEDISTVANKASQNGTSDLAEFLDHDVNWLAQPILDPIWRGCFIVNDENFGTVNGLVAYVSNQASPKVCEAASLLPSSFSLEMHPRLEVLPKKFARSDITDGDIGLYFFPEKERDERVFDKLLDNIIDQDLTMKAILEHAELLVFTSLQLPLQHWRYRGKYYLWGLFGKNKISYCSRGREHVTS